ASVSRVAGPAPRNFTSRYRRVKRSVVTPEGSADGGAWRFLAIPSSLGRQEAARLQSPWCKKPGRESPHAGMSPLQAITMVSGLTADGKLSVSCQEADAQPLPEPSMEPLDYLVIAPHPDDAELGAGGAILLLQAQGARVGVLDLTDGEPTPFGSPE